MTISRRRLLTRSSQTPAGSEKRRCGSTPTAVSVPICPASAPSVRTATRGRPSWVTWSPKTEIVWPSHSRRKSGASTRRRGKNRSVARAITRRSGVCRARRQTDQERGRIVLLLRELLLDFLVDLVLAVLPNASDHVEPEQPRPDKRHDKPDEGASAKFGFDGSRGR